MQGQNRGTVPSYTRDCDFFFNLQPLYLRAENKIFCVPRHYFKISDVFEGMFSLPGVPNTAQEGSSEACPVFLESIKADELKDFLRVLCSSFVTTDAEDAPIASTPTSWVSVLKLASLWQFTTVRKKALEHLKSEDCVSRLEISRQYSVEEWFLPALQDLIYRAEPLTADEVTRLGLDFAVKVIAFREEVLRLPNLAASGLGVVTRRRMGLDVPPSQMAVSFCPTTLRLISELEEEIGRAFALREWGLLI